MDSRQIVLGVFIDLIAAPFCYEGSTALMAKQWAKAIVAYIIGVPLAIVGLSAIGIIPWPVGSWVIGYIQPLAFNPRWGMAVLFFLLLWIGGPRFVRRMRSAFGYAPLAQPIEGLSESPISDSSLFDEDAGAIVHRVQFYTHLYVTGDPKLTGNAPFIEFLQPMINASVFPIAFEKGIEGHLFIDGEEQKDKLEIRETPPQSLEVRRAAHHELVFRQWLSAEVAKKIQAQSETIFDFGNMAVYFTFEYRGDRPRVRKALGNQVVWKNNRPEVQAASGWQPLSETLRMRLKDTLIAIGPHSILIEHNPIPDCVFFAYEIGTVFMDAGWPLYRQPYPATKPYNNLYFETDQNVADLVMRLVFSMANMGLVAAARHDCPSDADVLLFIGPRRPPVPLL